LVLTWAVATFVLCRCGSAAFSPSPPASDGGTDASLDGSPDVVIVVQTEAGGPADAVGAGCSAPTTLERGGTWVDPTLPANCGSCRNSCVGPEAGPGQAVCQRGGLCAVACDSDGGAAEILCTGACVSPDDVNHCRTCTNTCAAPPSGNGTATCPAAQCVMT